MGLLLYLSPAAIAVFALYHVVARVRLTANARSFGCQNAPLFRLWDVYGVASFRIEMNGMKTNRLSYAFLDRKKEMSAKIGRDCKTFRIKFPPGETWFYTLRPQEPTGRFGNAVPRFPSASSQRLEWEHLSRSWACALYVLQLNFSTKLISIVRSKRPEMGTLTSSSETAIQARADS